MMERVDDSGRQAAACSIVGLVIGGTELLCAPVGEFDLEVSFVGEHVCESAELTVGEPVGGAAQNVADPVERIVLSAAMAVEILLDPSTAWVPSFTT